MVYYLFYWEIMFIFVAKLIFIGKSIVHNMVKKIIRLTESELKEVVKDATTQILEDMTLNQKMSLNEMSQINMEEQGLDRKSCFDSNLYYVYVRGEGGFRKFPHFHIKNRAEGWDIRMNMDGTFNSIKTRSSNRQKDEDFADIERISINWVNKPNTLEPNKTNGEVATLIWKRSNS